MSRSQHLTLVQRVQRRIAHTAIAPSTLRSQGARGVVGQARDFLATLRLGKLTHIKTDDYQNILDAWTQRLAASFPGRAKGNWGAARKAINIFMVAAYFNKVLAYKYKLARFKDVLETPLDNLAAKEIKKRAKSAGRSLPKFETIKRLRPEVSHKYQLYASEVARNEGLHRAEVDLILWRS